MIVSRIIHSTLLIFDWWNFLSFGLGWIRVQLLCRAQPQEYNVTLALFAFLEQFIRAMEVIQHAQDPIVLIEPTHV